jgi:hypothetical protein
MAEFIEPLCVSALNTPRARPARQVFLRVLRDSLFSGRGGSNLLLHPRGLLAFVISASTGERETLQRLVVAQAREQLGLVVEPLRTITEKRATFACTPGLQRPPMAVAPGLLACGDYIAGPYPATLEGAVRSGRDAGNLP